ncbi:hypothetical protein PG993_008681 [Apiospora rasikravindrae]|uniref:Uncharacterized protein n=1 Tax=Apiospora rasikravindrae TaxID=990691 RepID=A0ABR1SQU4_9PEZI
MAQNAFIDPDRLPLGTSAVTVLNFNFLEAIHQFKKTLPADYIRDSWLNVLKKQCANTDTEPSLLYSQVSFLNGLYRRVLGDIAPESGWETMPAMISMQLNGPEDKVYSWDVFTHAMKENSEEKLLAWIAYGENREKKTPRSITTPVRVATKASVVTAAKGEAGNDGVDGVDREMAASAASAASSNKKRKVSAIMVKPFEPEHLPLGASAVSMMVVVFNFSEAITKFKNTLPGDYIKNDWQNDLEKQCNSLRSEMYGKGSQSQIYLQVKFLIGLYRTVCGRSAPKSGWEWMLPKLLPKWNGCDDRYVDPWSFLDKASKMTEKDMLRFIGNSSTDESGLKLSIKTTLPLVGASTIVFKDEAANEDDSLPAGEADSSTGGHKKRRTRFS